MIRFVCRALVRRAVVLEQERTYRRWLHPVLKEMKRRRTCLEREGELKPYRRSDFAEWNYDSELFAFKNRLGEQFDNDALRLAFDSQKHHQIAHKGDRILQLIVWYFLQTNLKAAPQPFIDAIGDYLVADTNLAKVSRSIGTYDLIIGPGYPFNEEIVARTFKALIGALNESMADDKQHVFRFVRDFVLVQLCEKDIHEIWIEPDPLRTLAQTIGANEEIEPRLCYSTGANTLMAVYQIGLYRASDKKLLGIGWGESIDIAREMAARNALLKIWQLEDHRKLFDFNVRMDETLFDTNKVLEN